ncbi:hypothetical protein DL89DRAFT_269331 [Linderina pennispora]|uniref:Uncharacterized protein n=1 Tax=Linderina pennispora TaxID=61395 RepID=A0A1Y1W204_9FUNG|nr:uncharacterized protein DL89DRAFT_269331 [Linderina pennispora]ORX67528.1 hypothetical protein DL89DRAFT_269331 [Linderina pennispora]
MKYIALVFIFASTIGALPCIGPTCPSTPTSRPLINLRIDASEDSRKDGLLNIDALDRYVVARVGGTPLAPEEKGKLINAEILVSSTIAPPLWGNAFH